MSVELGQLLTEARNPATASLDTLSTLEIVSCINHEDSKVPAAVAAELPAIAKAVDAVAAALLSGGRLIYIGAGTSGRLGILDASECPPTFGSAPEQVIGIIAGGPRAILQAVENAEDNEKEGVKDLQTINFNHQDVLLGIAASGRTPYVLGAMAWATHQGATVIALSCNPGSPMAQRADIAITPVVGPEVIAGSSRMKAGTAQKLVLNMITTGAMVRCGKVYGNLMVDVAATNAKLLARQVRIVTQATDCSAEDAEAALNASQRHCKTAIVMILTGLDSEQAAALLAKNHGFIRPALKTSGNNRS